MSFAFWESLCIYGLNITESHAEIPTDILVRLLLVPEARRLGLDIEDIDREVAVSKRYARASPEAYDDDPPSKPSDRWKHRPTV